MAYLTLKLRSDVPKYEFRVELDGTFYTLFFRFNSRMDRWIMDFKDSSGVAIIMGIPVLLGTNLLGRFASSKLPPGALFAINLKEANVDAGYDDLGGNVDIIYREAATT